MNDTTSHSDIKELVVCFSCEKPIKDAFTSTNFEGDSIDFYICMNFSCPRVGLGSITYKTKPITGGVNNG